LVDVVVTDENLHAVFLFDRAIDGPDGRGARATGARICRIRVPMAPTVRTNIRYLTMCLKIGTMLPIWKRRLWYVAVCWAALQTSQIACVCPNGRAGDKKQ
jgi:hypothetical protein